MLTEGNIGQRYYTTSWDTIKSLGSITGEVLADELLGHIFSSFCIGK